MTRDQAVFVVVVSARLLLPLLIFRWPLSIFLSLILDAADQTIFQTFTTIDLAGYQSYDKALDIYYLTIAYVSTMRNWKDLFAFRVSQFLYYYRLVGVVLFEFTQQRWLLFIFPNTFEYFFIFYEIVRLRWDPRKMSRRFWILGAAAIWIFIKLPQEWWIHIAQNDVTDFLKETVFGVSKSAGWGEALTNRPAVTVAIAAGIAALVAFGWWLWTKRLPPSDHEPSLSADPLPGILEKAWERRDYVTRYDRFVSMALLEKIVLISLVCIIFGQILPGVRASNLQIAVGVAALVAVNSLIGLWTARRGLGFESALLTFLALGLVNLGLVFLANWLLPRSDGSLNLGPTVFFILLLTLIVTLYDMYRPLYEWRSRTRDMVENAGTSES